MESHDSSSAQEKHDALLQKMKETKEKWDAEAGSEEDDTDRLLSQAMQMAIDQGKGWSPGEKEAYLKKILDDDFIPPIFASSQEELEKSGLADAFSSLVYDETPTQLMLSFKKKGNKSFQDGKRNQVKNMQYYRDAVNFYYEAFAWAQKVEPIMQADVDSQTEEADEETYTEQQLDEMKSILCSNAAMAHMQLKNWGHVRDDATKALTFNQSNVKAWYRLAKAHQMLQNWEEAGDAIDSGLAIAGEGENKDLKKLQSLLAEKVRKARLARQKRERARAERVSRVKETWKHCQEIGIQLGRVPLVATVTDDEDTDGGLQESRWHHHHPHTGQLPQLENDGNWSWPCMFVYPSHSQSDFIKHFGEADIIALRMAELFPELEDGETETAIPWDYNNEFICSKLAVYFEVHCTEMKGDAIHPESVERLNDQASAMRFYESSRALKGDEGPDMANVAEAVERKHLHRQRKAWKKEHGSLWAKPEPCPVIRVHPAATLRDVLTDSRMVVPNFLVTFLLFPMDHPAHEAYLKEHRFIGMIDPSSIS